MTNSKFTHHYSFYIMGGFGHIKPAQALAEQFSKLGLVSREYDPASPDGSPVHESANLYNFFSRTPPLNSFWNIVTRHDLLPAWLFQPVHILEVLFNQKTIQRLKRLPPDSNKTILTATHFTPALLTAKAFPKQKIFLYVTDIHPHGLWKLLPENIHYLVPMEETKIDLLRYGIPTHRVSISSFPIHNEILKDNRTRFQNRLNTLRRKNLKAIDVLVISGGAGTGKREMAKLLHHFLEPAKAKAARLTFLVSTPQLESQLIAICAHNQTTKQQVFIDRYSPHSLYSALAKAEVLITKAGGDVTFEALAEGLPIYTLKDVGDHERLNRQYLELIGASKPLFLTHHPWNMIQSDIASEEIIHMAKAAHKNGFFHRQSNTPQTILKLL